MLQLPRLFKILRVVRKYRLDDFVDRKQGTLGIRLLLLSFRIRKPVDEGEKRGVRLRKAMEDLGPIYIKFGQLLSTRRDFIPKDLADELENLQDNVPPFEEPRIDAIVKKSLGRNVEEIFKKLDPKPFASASVAQVHKALLKNDDEVVVKIIRPNIEKIIHEDIQLLKWVAKLFQTHTNVGRRLRPIEVVNDYEEIILGELDLRSEAANTSQLARNFHSSSKLYVPKVYWDFTRENVMVMERIDGIPVNDLAQLEKHKVDLKKLAETGVDIFFTQVFEHNFFHADMHPGNIFVSKSNKSEPQYIAIDCAIIGSLSKEDQQYLAKNLLAIFKRDYRKVARLHIECGWVPKKTKIHEFESAIRMVCEPIFEKPLKDISFGQLLTQLFQTASRFNMEVQPSLVLLQKTLLNIEGLGRQLYPNLDLWKTALPYLENWNAKRLSPFKLLEQIQKEIPNWIDRLPEIPELLIKATSHNYQLEEQNILLQKKQEFLDIEREKKRRSAKLVGVISIFLAGISLFRPIADLTTNLPIFAILLGGIGLYLLYFNR